MKIKMGLKILLLIAVTFLNAMEAPKKSNGIFSRAKELIITPLTPQKATAKLVELLNSKDKKLTLKNVQPLIEAGANINIASSGGKNLLTKILEQGYDVPLIEYIVQKGARLQDNKFFIQAVSDDHLKLVRLLLAAGANVDAKGQGGIGALYHAVYSLNYDMVKLLVEAGADVNIKTETGTTPIMVAIGGKPIAARRKDVMLSIIKLLINNGAKITPEIVELVKGNRELKEYIEKNRPKLKKLE